MNAADERGLIEALKGKGELDGVSARLAIEDVEDLEQLWFEEDCYAAALTGRSTLANLNSSKAGL